MSCSKPSNRRVGCEFLNSLRDSSMAFFHEGRCFLTQIRISNHIFGRCITNYTHAGLPLAGNHQSNHCSQHKFPGLPKSRQKIHFISLVHENFHLILSYLVGIFFLYQNWKIFPTLQSWNSFPSANQVLNT